MWLIYFADGLGCPDGPVDRHTFICKWLMLNILEFTHDQFIDAFRRRYGRGADRATALYRHVMKRGGLAVNGLPGPPGDVADLAGQLLSEPDPKTGRLVRRLSEDGVVKCVTRLADGLEIESVVIPMFKRNTLCISSQVGCRMGCRFCRTGKMGLIRNLTVGEIVGQVFNARHRLGVDIRNVVFMGMGEPLDNLDNVLQAMRVLVDQRGLDIARRYITVSTAGLTAGIDRLARCDAAPVNLAVSLNAPNDAVRSHLMPINKAIPMAALRDSLMRYPLARKAALFVEYVLIRDVNDRDAHARELARYLSPMKVKLNLIACNPAPGSGFNPPSGETFERFHASLVARKVFVRRRGGRGGKIMAACGQLGGRGL